MDALSRRPILKTLVPTTAYRSMSEVVAVARRSSAPEMATAAAPAMASVWQTPIFADRGHAGATPLCAKHNADVRPEGLRGRNTG
jgi:hypothetical protein